MILKFVVKLLDFWKNYKLLSSKIFFSLKCQKKLAKLLFELSYSSRQFQRGYILGNIFRDSENCCQATRPLKKVYAIYKTCAVFFSKNQFFPEMHELNQYL